MSKITYLDKVALNENPDIPDINKVKAEDMNEIKAVVNNNATETSKNTTDIANISGTILWTNPNPNADFGLQTISLSDSDFDYIDIIYNNYISRNTYEVDRVYKNYPSSEIGGTFNYEGKIFSGTRPLAITNNGSKIAFETAYGSRLDTYSFGAHNDWYIPIKIIGYKTGLFS